MKKAAVYLRYSSERQTEQSIEGQMRVCSEYAKNNDLLIVETYIDRATTGTNDNRADFQRMLKEADKKPAWEILLVYSIDRFGRNSIEMAVNKQRLKKNGIVLISATQRTSDNIDGTKNLDGILLENVYIGLAEYYSAELSQKVRRGMKESRLKKQFTGGRVLYGYIIKDKKYQIEPLEAEVVLMVGNSYADGNTAKEIKTALDEKGILDKNGKPFTINDIYRMVKQEKYAGIYRSNGVIYEDVIPPIYSEELWRKLQMISKDNKQAPARNKASENFLLSGKMFCGECKGRYIGESGRGRHGTTYYYYKCAEKKRHNQTCSMKPVSKEYIEHKVFEICCTMLRKTYIPHLAQSALDERAKNKKENPVLDGLERNLAEKKRTLNNLLKAVENGIFTKTTQQRMSELEEEIETLNCKIEAEHSKQAETLTVDSISDFLYQFTVENSSEELKKMFFSTLVRKVVLFPDKICITFNYSPDDGKGTKRTYDLDAEELTSLQSEYASSEKCSTISSLPSPKTKSTPHGVLFVFSDPRQARACRQIALPRSAKITLTQKSLQTYRARRNSPTEILTAN